jgi:uncharacterized protein YbjT (DUF2867 family)
MTSILLLGATGLVGSHILTQASNDKRIERITLLSRTVISNLHSKVTTVVMPLDAMENAVEAFHVDAVVCALGTTMKKAGSQKAFRTVDFEYPLNTAMLAHRHGVRHFLLVSALGADSQSKVFYNRVKGETESAITRIPFERITIVRPSLLLGERKEFRLGERIGQLFAPFIPAKYKPVHAHDAASVLIASLFDTTSGVHIIESKDIVTFAGRIN